MRKILFILFLAGAAIWPLFGQSPVVWLSEDEFYKEITAGGADSQMVVIQNKGNRDLIWSLKDVKGPGVSFSKADYADWELPVNQDRIKPDVWITRTDEQGIFNIAVENEYNGNSPQNTLWAFSRTMDAEPMDYTDWRSAVNNNPPSMVGNTISMYLQDYTEFFDIVFDNWTEGGLGGGFSYTRYEAPIWLDGSKNSGTIIPGATDTIWVFYNGEYLYQREYIAYVAIQTNDPASPLVNLTFNLNVTSGNATIEFDEGSVDYGNAFVNFAKSYSLKIYNNGTGTLVINNITTGLPEFSPRATTLEVPAKDSRMLEIDFTPIQKKFYSDTLYISSNDTTYPIFKMPLTGTGIAAADINVNPLSFNESGELGTPLVKKLAISNTDSSDLEWEIKINTSLSKFGPSVNFTKADGVDWTLAANQDPWTPNVTITRANSQGIFNIADEGSYQWDVSPSGTLWSYGKTREVAPDDYEVWRDAVNSNPPSMVGKPMSVYLTNDDMYADIVFNSWTQSGGGGFSYTRQLLAKWMHPETSSGTTTAISTDTVLIDFNTFSLPNGTYNGSIVIISNDPDEDSIVIPVQYTITGGVQNISVDTMPLDFGDVFTGATKKMELKIENNGQAGLDVTDIQMLNSEFVINPVSFVLMGDSVKIISIDFTPQTVEGFTDTLYITSNDPETPLIKIPVTANAIAAPDIELTPAGISVDIISGDTIVYKLAIKNTGGNLLEYDIPGTDIVNFKKTDYADWRLAENQDRITDNVWITRANSQGIFNIFSESNYDNSSPEGTEWAYGNSSDLDPEDYQEWRDAVFSNPPGMVGNVISLHLIEEDIYYDVEFNSWTESANGGGFSYIRYKALPKWVELQNTSGLIAPGQTDTVEMWFIAGSLPEMTYNTNVLVRTNIPGKESVMFTAEMDVTGIPDITVATTDIDFGTVYLGYPDTLQLMVSNTGTDSLVIENISTLTGYFGTVEDQLLIMPGEQQPLHIFFSPDALTNYEDTLKFTTNVAGKPAFSVALLGEGANPPNLFVEPEMLSYYTFYNNIINDTIWLNNSGIGKSVWDVKVVPQKLDLENVLTNLNSNSADIIAAIPNRYDFAYDGGSNYIGDGGNDMYDGGNYINTSNGGGNIEYSDNTVVGGDMYFGFGTSYFTRHLNGLFVFAADLINIDAFRITGELGADGSGNVDATVLKYDYYGYKFNGFVKRVYNASDPSVNHLVIIPDNPDATQKIASDTDDDLHEVNGISNTKRIYYLLYAGTDGYYIDDANTQAIMESFIQSIYATPDWINLAYTADTIVPASTDTIGVTINTTGLASGIHNAKVIVACNNPVQPYLEIPIELNVYGIKVVNPIADVLKNEGFVSDTVDFANVFEDAEGDPLTYVIVSTDTDVVTVDTTGEKIVITEAGTGTSTISVRASDGNGNAEFEDFLYKVNAIPEVVEPVKDTVVQAGFGSITIDLSTVITDADADTLVFEALSGNTGVVTVAVTGNILTIQEVAWGISTVTISATDGMADSEADEFVVTVNATPTVANPLADITVDEGFATRTVELATVFADNDDATTLTLTAESSNQAVVTVAIAGTTLTVTEVGTGNSNITVTAS
ncbi:MAG: choice-of-anchor D domain-containing protein, partial [Bacteroidales bacterium]|nr:choice-of-anchor D domain-containing protein [Bacteroidales bacterium]